MIYTRYLLLIALDIYQVHRYTLEPLFSLLLQSALAISSVLRSENRKLSDHEMASDRKYRPRLRDHSERRSGAPLRIFARKD